MRKQSQLADLIAGSGLVSGIARRSSSQDGHGTTQPVLYHFGGKAGSTSAKEREQQRDRPPLPAGPVAAGPPSSTSGPNRPPPGVAWSSPNGTPGSTISYDSVASGSGPPASQYALPSTSSAPLPLLGLQRGGGGPDAGDAAGPGGSGLGTSPSSAPYFPPHGASGFLPAVGGAGNADLAPPTGDPHLQQYLYQQQQQFADAISAGHSAGGAPPGLHPDPRSGGGGGSSGGGSGSGGGGTPHQHAPAAAASFVLTSELQQQHQQQQGSSGGGWGTGFGSSMDVGGAGAWQQSAPHQQHPAQHAQHAQPQAQRPYSSTDWTPPTTTGSGGGGGPPRSTTPNSVGGGAGGRGTHVGGGKSKAYGGGGGGFNGTRWSRPNSTPRAGGIPSGMQRSASECSVRGSNGDLAGVATAMSVQGAWSGGDGSGSGTGGGAGGGAGGPAGASRMSRTSALSAAQELVVVEEEGSTAEVQQGGSSGVPGDGRWSLTQLNHVAVVPNGASTSTGGSGPSTPAADQQQQWNGGFVGPPNGTGSAHSPPPPLPSTGPGSRAGLPAAAATTNPGAYPGDPGGGGGGMSAFGSSNELMELRRMVAELQGQVARLTAQLRDSELSAAQLQSMAAAAVASEREAAETEAGRRHMKALKSAEAARDRAEVARRGAEKRAKQAEDDLTAVKEKLEAKTKQAADLETALAAAQASLDRQRKVQDEAVETLEAQHKAQARKAAQDADTEKKALQETISKQQAEVAKRNQTILALQADLEAAQAAGTKKDEQIKELQAAVAKLEAELERERGRRQVEASENARLLEHLKSEVARPDSPSLPSSPTGRSRADPSDVGGAPTATGTSAPSPLPSGARRGASFSAASTASGPIRPLSTTGGGGGSGPLMDEQSRAIRKLQSEVAAIREDYARRLVELDEVVATCEASMRDGIMGLERMFKVIVSRTAGILAGRLGFKPPPGTKTPAARPGTPNGMGSAAGAAATSAGVGVGGAGAGTAGRPTTAAAIAAANGANNAILHMNERLAAENAQLLAELTRWQTGRHAMLRKLNMTVLGADPAPAPPPPPLTHQQKIAQALAAVTGGGGQHASGAAAAAAAAAATANATAQPQNSGTASGAGGPRQFMYQQNFNTPPGGAATYVAEGGGGGPMTPAREALAAATRDSLLAGRKELLPAVMTAEGWGGAAVQGGWDTNTTTQQLHGGKVEASLAAAESSLRLRTQLLALQAEVTKSRAAGGEVVERGREQAAMQESHEAALSDLRRELAAAKHQTQHLQRELERARAGINTTAGADGRSSGMDSIERDRLEESLSAAREDAQRHKAVASAARRELEAKERLLEELQIKHERLDAQYRDVRSEAQRHSESVKRLRVLLAQAKVLLKEQGVAFMEDDQGLEQLLAAEKDKDKDKDKGGKKQQRPGTAGGDPDAPLFKALDAREREKEMQRLQGELADCQAQLAAANKELKKARKQATQQQEAAAAEAREQRLQLANTIDALAREAEAAKDTCRGLQKQLQDSQHDCGELRRQLSDLNDKLTRAKLDADYLRARAAAGKMKPKLSHAKALSISISASAAVPPEG